MVFGRDVGAYSVGGRPVSNNKKNHRDSGTSTVPIDNSSIPWTDHLDHLDHLSKLRNEKNYPESVASTVAIANPSTPQTDDDIDNLHRLPGI